jgi:hypothetical protein
MLTAASLLRSRISAAIDLFDKGLPVIASSQNGTDTARYDRIGRSFYFGLKARF